MKDKTQITDIMNKDLVVLNMNDTIREAENVFRNHFLRHAPVVSHGQLVGMLSLVDMKTRTGLGEEETSGMIPMLVQHLMTPDPVSVQANAFVREVAVIFTENEFHAVPVLDGDRVVGIVSTTDIIKYFLELVD